MYYKLCILALTAFLAFITSADATCASTCVNGLCYSDECACTSGYIGGNCDDASSSAGCAFNTISNLETDHFATVDQSVSGIFSNNLRIRVEVPLVDGRRATRAYLDNFTQYPACAYPGSVYWTKKVESCVDVFELDMPWSEASACGWDFSDTSNPGFDTFSNVLYVQHDDLVDTFRGNDIIRDTMNVIPVNLKFQNSVEVSTELNLFSAVNLLAAITEQKYDPVISEGKLEITTSLQWPFQLEGVSIDGLPLGIDANISSANADCGATADSACLQLFTFTIDPNEVCSLSGDYNLSFTVSCRGAPEDCPLDDATNSAVVLATVNSEDFCVGLNIEIGLSGTMRVYQDAAHSALKDDFLHEQTAHFKIDLVTEALASITNHVISSIRIKDSSDNSTTFLRQSGTTNQNGNDCSLAITSASPSVPSFSLIPNQGIFPVAVDSAEVFTVTAVVDVDYEGGARKRMLIERQLVEPGSQETESNSDIGVQPVPQPEESEVEPIPSDLVVEDSSAGLALSVLLALVL